MQLLDLELNNFRSHKNTVLDFTKFDSAVVVGENGVGKSSFAYGLGYCFWGDVEDTKNSDLIYTNALSMDVATRFMHDDGNIYRVVRGVKVSGVKKKTYTSFLSLLQQDPNGAVQDRLGNSYIDVSGNSIVDTTKRISALLGGLTFKTAIYSNFDLQGQSALFMQASSAERRKLFEDILNLSAYEKLEKKARAKAKEAKIALQALDIDDTKESELNLKIKNLDEQTITLKQQGTDLQEIIDEISKRKHALELIVKNGTSDVDKKKAPLEEDLQKQMAQIEEAENKLQSYAKILANKEDIVANNELLQTKLAEFKQSQETRQAYTIAKGERKTVANTLAMTEGNLEQARSKLTGKKTLLTAERNALLTKFKLEDQNQDLVAWMTTTLEALQVEQAANLEKLAILQQDAEASNKEKAEIVSKIVAFETNQQTINGQIKKIQSAGAMCPIFNKPCEKLTQEQKELELAELKSTLQKIDEDISGLSQNKNNLTAAITELNKKVIECQELDKTCTRRIMILNNDIANFAKLQEQTLKEIQTLEDEISRLQETICALEKELDGIDKTIIATGFNPDEYSKLEQDIAKLENEKWHEQRDLLITAEASIDDLKARLEEYEQNKNNILSKIQVVEQEIEAKKQEVAQATIEFESAQSVLNNNKAKLDEVNSGLANIAKEVGIAQTLLNQMREQKNKSIELQQQMQDFGALERTYKKARALIVENSVPRFQEMCNNVLEYLEVKIRVRIETLEESKDNKTKEIKLTPTFKVIVIDGNEGVERDYNTWSGGEKQRINLAIRQALSSILLNRAGIKMDLVIIDESDSALDDDGKQAMIKLIQANVEGRFGKPTKVLCITHTSELKDSFPVRIVVKKNKKASYIAEIQ